MNEKNKMRSTYLFIISIVILSIVFMLNVSLGSVSVDFTDIIQAITNPDQVSDINFKIITAIRLPRTMAAILGGACLAIAGVLLQIFFNNPIVEPYILGVSSGSNLFVGIVMLTGFKFGFSNISSLGMFVGSFIGAMVVMCVVIFASQKVKSITTLLIIGMMFGYVCSSATSILTALADKENIANFSLWTMGSFSGFLWSDVKLLYTIGLPFIFIAFLISKPLNTMILGEEYAKSMGLSTKPFRMLIVLISSVLTAVVTAFAGPVSFVGLAVPHLTRIAFRTSDNRIIIPAACIFGGIMTGICDLCCRLLIAPYELPLGAMTSIIGAPLLVFLLVSKKENEL